MEVLMIKYDGRNGRKWWKRSLGASKAKRLMYQLERAGKNPMLITANVDAEHLMDVASSLFVSRSSVSLQVNSR